MRMVERRVQSQITNIFTIGHSAHTYERFLSLLRAVGVTAIADVRSAPYSRYSPQFNRAELRDALRQSNISYVFLGKELGGRPDDKSFYSGGVADYEKMAASVTFKNGLERVIDGARTYSVALMCSEQDPLDCHRCLLVGRALLERDIDVSHVLSSGLILDQKQVEDKLLEIADKDADDFFVSRVDRLAEAYRERAQKIAFAESQPDSSRDVAAE